MKSPRRIGGMAAAWAAAVLLVAAAAVGPVRAAGAAPFELTDDRGARVRFDAPPRRIVSMLPSLTETVCALGACERLVGVDRYSGAAPALKHLPELGGLDDVLVERLYALKPDVVLVSRSTRVLERLESLGLKVLALESNSLADTRRSVALVARLIGQPEAGGALLARIDERSRAAAARIPAAWRGARVYFEIAATPFAAGEASFIGELLTQLGLGNVVPAALGPFPQLNPEYVVRARPELMMGSRRNVTSMATRPGWGTIPALQAGHVCAFDAAQNDVLVRPGPRLAEAAEIVADCVAALPKAGPAR